MGFTPAQMNEMSFWEAKACAEGFNRAHSPEDAVAAPSNDEFDDMLERMSQIQDKRSMN